MDDEGDNKGKRWYILLNVLSLLFSFTNFFSGHTVIVTESNDSTVEDLVHLFKTPTTGFRKEDVDE